MIILANLLAGLAFLLAQILWFMTIVIIARVIISWVNADPYNGLVRAIVALSEPVLRFIRRYVPTVFGGLDLAPLIAILAVQLTQVVIVGSLSDYSATLRAGALLHRQM